MSEMYFTLPSEAKIEALVAKAERARREESRAMIGRGMRKIANGFRLFERSLMAAREARWLYEMGDAELTSRGIDRQQIPAMLLSRLNESVPDSSHMGAGRVTANDDRPSANSNVGAATPARRIA